MCNEDQGCFLLVGTVLSPLVQLVSLVVSLDGHRFDSCHRLSLLMCP